MLVTSVALHTPHADAVEIPPTGSPFFFQTNGPTAALGLGDWYSSNVVGAGAGYHYIQFVIPCSWPTSTPVTVDLFSPEMNTDAGALAQHEEPNGALNTTTFELYGPGAVVGPGFTSPAAGAGTVLTNYPPAAAGVAEAWVRFATINPATCGSYVVRSATAGDDQNGWRIRVGFDVDANVATAPVTDLDGVAGTDDEIILGQNAVSYQQNSGANACIDLFEYVAPGQATLAVHNFDYDGFDIPGSSVNYFSPSGVNTAGTVSSPSATWNVSDAITRGAGDVIANPETGWWRFNSCISSGNQMIQEGQQGVNAYSEHPPTPDVMVTKSDGRLTAAPGDALTYAVHITNPGDPSFPGAATAVVATDTLPANTTFVSCGFAAPAAGTCTQAAGIVTATLTGALVAGGSADVNVQVTVNGGASGTITNGVSVAYSDSFGNVFAPVTATDVDTIGTGSIGDHVFLDKNANATQDGADVGLAGVGVTVTWYGVDDTFGTGDDDTFNTTTDSAGNYLVNGLPAGTYRVQATTPAGTVLDVGTNPATVVLANGQNRTDVDFGFVGTGSIGDTVFFDKNSNGLQDGTDTGISSVAVAVTWAGPDNTLGNADDVVFTTTTNGTGNYTVGNLPAGNYRVDPTAPAGFTNTTVDPLDTSLSAGQNRTDADFGYNGNASVGDLVWFDIDGDGVQDVGEPGLPNVSVAATCVGPDGISGNSDDLLRIVSTNAAGAYTIPSLPPGACSVDVNEATAPPGMVGTSTDPLAITLTPGQVFTTADFGFTGTGSIGDTVFDDANGDGIQNGGEGGINAVPVVVTWAGPDTVLGTGDDVAFNTATNGTGSYSVGNLPSGNYRVDPTAPPGMILTTSNDPLTTTLSAGQNRTDADFGFVLTGTVGDFVWFDLDGDGVQDAGEPGLGSVTVRLLAPGPDTTFGTGDDVFTTTATGANGAYLFTDVVPGPYRVSVDSTTLPGNMVATTSATVSVSLVGGQQFLTADFGFVGTGSIGDLVFHDVNGNGVTDGTETGIAGVGLQLTWAGVDNTFSTSDDVVLTTTTHVSGGYLFSGLPAGSYSVDPTGPAGFTLTAGTDPTPVTLGVTQNVLTADFGYRGTASIGDTVFDDANGNATQDGGEPGLSGVTVTATWAGFDGTIGNGDDLVFTALTNGSGVYTVPNLPPGSYSVAVSAGVPAGFVATTTAPIGTTLTAGEVELTDDFGYQVQADLVIAKTTNTPTVVVGEDASWTVTVSNNGPATAAAPIVVTDTLPAGTAFVSGTGTDWGCLESTGTVTCTYAGVPATLANGGTLPSITITATVTASAALTIMNTATVTSPTADPDLENNTATDDATTQPAADITITKSHAGNFLVGSQGSYSILVGNGGPSTSAGPFTVTDALPAGLTFVSASGGPSWTCGQNTGTITCTATGPLASGATLPVITVTVNVTTEAEGGVTNTAVVDPGVTLDPDLTNNTSSDPTIVVPIADLAIVKTAPGPFVVGDQATYSLNVSNNGPSTSVGPITVTDTLPVGLTFVSGDGTGWSCSVVVQDITCTHSGSLPSGVSTVVTVTVTVDATVASVIDNTAVVTGTTQDPDPSNNTSTVQSPTTPTIDLAIAKTHTGNFVIGTPATYTVTVANNGPSAATGTITVHDPVPAGLTPADATGTGWTCGIVAQDITCTNETDLASGASLPPITVTVDVAPAAYPSVTNTTNVDTPPGANETILDNNTDTDPAAVAPLADLAIVKAHVGNFIVGTDGTYVLTVTNNGPTEAIGPIVVTDTLMGGLDFVSGDGDGFT